jgi:hypothetical protein
VCGLLLGALGLAASEVGDLRPRRRRIAPHTEGASGCLPLVPCSDPRGCPDLVVEADDLASSWRVESQTFPPDDCSVLEGEVVAGTRRLLRFDSVTPNLGPGDLIVGVPLDHPEWFDLATCHGHEHFKEYADYRLWTPEGYASWTALRRSRPEICARDLLRSSPEIADQMVQGHKQGFCVIDIQRTGLGPCSGRADPPRYFDCGDQGISVCWADVYDSYLEGQWIDITGLPAGDYVLEVEVNAERFFQEDDYADNSAAVPLTLSPP